MNDLVKKLEALRIELDEATTPNAYRIGTVRTWKSGRFKKTATGWVPVSSMMKSVANKPKGAVKPQLVKSGGKPPARGPTVGGEKFAPGYTKKAAEYEKKTRGESYDGFRRLAGLSDDRTLGEADAATKYADDPVAYNAQLAKLMQQLKRDKSLGVTGVRQGYKGTGSTAHKRQIWAKVPSHERGGPDIWLDSGFVKVGGIIDIPKTIPSTMKYGDESPEAVYKWISDTMKQLKAWTDAKYAQSPAVAPKAEEVELRRELEESGVANMSDEDVVKTARALASKAHKGKLSPKETKDFKMAMQRIKDEGLLGHDDEDDIWKWYGKGGQ